MANPKSAVAPGTVFSKWTVLGEDPIRRTGNRHIYHFVRCGCGHEASITGNALRTGQSKSCQPCSKIALRGHPDAGPVIGPYMSSLIRGANKRGHEVTITMQDLADQWELQGGKCALTGYPLVLRSGSEDRSATASVDRIDSNIGYTPENIQWTHKNINRFKMDWSEETFFEMCRDVVNHKDETVKLRGSRPWLKGV